MSPKRPFLAAVCVSLLTLTACPPGQSTDDSESGFFVVSAAPGLAGYKPTGWGWKPNSKLEISIWNEPDGPGSASTQWKKILDETVDPSSLFGFNSGAPVYPVARSICGNPANGQTVLIMAKSLTTGKIRMFQAPADIYFTFQPCR